MLRLGLMVGVLLFATCAHAEPAVDSACFAAIKSTEPLPFEILGVDGNGGKPYIVCKWRIKATKPLHDWKADLKFYNRYGVLLDEKVFLVRSLSVGEQNIVSFILGNESKNTSYSVFHVRRR